MNEITITEGHLDQMKETLEVMQHEGTPTDTMVLSLVYRLLADDWTGSGVYEALDQALSAAEALVPQD